MKSSQDVAESIVTNRDAPKQGREVPMANRVLVMNGWSNSGKTSFCLWLEKTIGFVHVNADKNGIDKHGLRGVWEKVGAGDASDFKAVLQQRSKATVLD